MTIDDITTPAYIIDENILVHNLEILKYVEDKTGCKILLAQKAFSAFYEYPLPLQMTLHPLRQDFFLKYQDWQAKDMNHLSSA